MLHAAFLTVTESMLSVHAYPTIMNQMTKFGEKPVCLLLDCAILSIRYNKKTLAYPNGVGHIDTKKANG